MTKVDEHAQRQIIETVDATRKKQTATLQRTLKLRLVIAYDGTRYQGWQAQKIGIGVQQIVEERLRKLFPSVTRIHGSSRTDTGVHAIGMAAHVEIPRAEFRMTPRKLVLAMNSFLPDDIRVLSAVKTTQQFHARFDASGKQYRYFVWNHVAMNPLLRTQAWHVPLVLDFPAMREAARFLIGRHDFKCFAVNRNYEMETTVRTVTRCDIKRSGPLLSFTIEGDGFLYKMCRGIVGTLVQIGKGKFTVDDVKTMLAARDRRAAGMSAPAHGLVLRKVFYSRGKVISNQ
ncbi:MAG TPA: tRNA pseudouridine(38-40) synthase TruA [Candidatus Acidoferrum sp.]|nr:tRNA pseudouridine(38-40) synthase TruA [Candidatus Acidoferrum sp.]